MLPRSRNSHLLASLFQHAHGSPTLWVPNTVRQQNREWSLLNSQNSMKWCIWSLILFYKHGYQYLVDGILRGQWGGRCLWPLTSKPGYKWQVPFCSAAATAPGKPLPDPFHHPSSLSMPPLLPGQGCNPGSRTGTESSTALPSVGYNLLGLASTRWPHQQLLWPPPHPGLSRAGGWPGPAPRSQSVVARSPAELSRPALRVELAETPRLWGRSRQVPSVWRSAPEFSTLTWQAGWEPPAANLAEESCNTQGSRCWGQTSRHPPGTATSALPWHTALPTARSPCATPPQTSPPSPNLLPGACSRLLSRLIFKYLISSRIFSTLGGKVGGWEGGIKIRLCHRSQERLLYPHSQLAPANRISEFMLILSLIITSQALRNQLSGKHPS